MLPLADASAATLLPFVKDYVELGTRVITDGWQGYRGLEKIGYVHDRRSQRAARAHGDDPGELLPAVHRIASLAKRWLLGTHQGAVDDAHLASYLNEFVFRFNRRRSRSRGMVFYRVLELAAAHAPVRYKDIVATQRPRQVPPSRRTRTGTRRAWTDLRRTARGGRPSRAPVKWRPLTDRFVTEIGAPTGVVGSARGAWARPRRRAALWPKPVGQPEARHVPEVPPVVRDERGVQRTSVGGDEKVVRRGWAALGLECHLQLGKVSGLLAKRSHRPG
jgi:transposase-like protein